MASPYTQNKRMGELKTPLGDDVLVLTQFNATEGVSELFEYRIEALCAKKEILNFTPALGKNCSVSIMAINGNKRWFDGILTETQCLGSGNGGILYQLVLRPSLWVLSQRRNSLIFHKKTAPAIISEIFGKYSGLIKFDKTLSKTYPELEYCVQYRESDMDFVCRLMEQNGISYHFRHSQGEHKLIMGDSRTAWKKIDGGTRPYYEIAAQHRRKEEHFFEWMPTRRFTTGKVTLKDYNFKTPGNSLLVEQTGDATYAHGGLEDYDYPGKHPVEGDGKLYAQARIDMERAADERFLASGDCVSCYPGSLVILEKHPSSDQNKEYLALRCTHKFVTEEYRSGGTADISEAYQGSYEFMRCNRNFAPPMVTEKPLVYGPQTGKVVGSSEIPCDEYGRVHVRFYWDRAPDQSMWCRVSQIWASKEWGSMFIPRKGMEVIVEFLEGDPDQPIIVGCVYNAENMPPYKLEGQKNIAGFKSNSTEGGGGYNELILDDTKGKELIRTHAQFDLESTIEHDERHHVKNDRSTIVNGNRVEVVDKDEILDVHGKQTETIDKDRTTTVKKNDSLTVKKTLKIDAADEISIVCGAASIVMKKNGDITINGFQIKQKASGEFTIKGQIVHIN